MKETKLDICFLDSYPIQYKIFYKNLRGQKCLLILTQSNELTNNEDDLKINTVHFGIIGKHIVQHAANLSKKGDYKGAEAYLKAEKEKYSNIPILDQAIEPMKEALHFQNNDHSDSKSLTKHTDSMTWHLNSAFKSSHLSDNYQV